MKKTMSIVVGVALLLLVGSVDNLFAEELNNTFGVKYLYESSSGDWDSSNGLELSTMFDLTPASLLGSDKGRFYLEGFIDVLSPKLDTDIIVGNRKVSLEGDFSTIVLGASLLYKNKSTFGSSSASAYFGGGVGYYINDLKLSADTQNNLVEAYWDQLAPGVDLYSYNFDVAVENALGFHLKAGVEIEVSPQIHFSIDYRMNFVKMDITTSESAIINDALGNDWLLLYDAKGELERGDMITTGISVRF